VDLNKSLKMQLQVLLQTTQLSTQAETFQAGGTLSVTGRSTLTGNTIATTAGTGITTGTGTVYEAGVIKIGGSFSHYYFT
jgi:hypothetical protein